MVKKSINLVLIMLAIIILIAVAFAIISKNKSLTRGVSQTGDENMEKIVRQPAVAGSFYPASKSELGEMINGFFSNVAEEKVEDQPRVLVVPHAGYPYSGQTAAYAFKQLQGQGFKKAIIIGPSHNFPVAGLFLSSATHWQTPLGLIKIADINSALAKEDGFSVSDQVHEPEHALEVEIPFLQIVAPGIEIVPIVVGQLSVKQQSDFAKALDRYLDSDVVLIVSVDLSHYHPYDEAVDLDKKSIENILNLKSDEILADEIDAPWAVAAVLELARQKNWQPKLLKYENSGDVTGDKSAVVGYAAIGFYGTQKPFGYAQGRHENTKTSEEYSDDEKQELLTIARKTIEMYLKKGKTYEPETDNFKFKQERGVFVTLHKNGQLRGCIGYIEPIKPLIEAVRDNAISAAVDDDRFLPLEAKELAEIEIEISVLTLPKPDTLENIVKNKKGAVLRQGGRGAIYLPQVWDDLSDPEQFFQTLCLKGGLEPDCYKDPATELFSYEAIVFDE